MFPVGYRIFNIIVLIAPYAVAAILEIKKLEELVNICLIYDNLVKQNENNIMEIYKPMPAPIDKIKNRYRWRIIIRCRFSNTIIDKVNDSIIDIKGVNTRITVDVNPNSMI